MHRAATPKSGIKTIEQVRAEFSRVGRTVQSWAEEHGFKATAVYAVLYGRSKGLRGESHEIAVRLGIKEGIALVRRRKGGKA